MTTPLDTSLYENLLPSTVLMHIGRVGWQNMLPLNDVRFVNPVDRKWIDVPLGLAIITLTAKHPITSNMSLRVVPGAASDHIHTLPKLKAGEQVSVKFVATPGSASLTLISANAVESDVGKVIAVTVQPIPQIDK